MVGTQSEGATLSTGGGNASQKKARERSEGVRESLKPTHPSITDFDPTLPMSVELANSLSLGTNILYVWAILNLGAPALLPLKVRRMAAASKQSLIGGKLGLKSSTKVFPFIRSRVPKKAVNLHFNFDS